MVQTGSFWPLTLSLTRPLEKRRTAGWKTAPEHTEEHYSVPSITRLLRLAHKKELYSLTAYLLSEA